MHRLRSKARLLSLLLATIFVAGQLAAQVHAAEHDKLPERLCIYCSVGGALEHAIVHSCEVPIAAVPALRIHAAPGVPVLPAQTGFYRCRAPPVHQI